MTAPGQITMHDFSASIDESSQARKLTPFEQAMMNVQEENPYSP